MITGASPTGASPTETAQTITSASGSVTTVPAGQVRLNAFRDTRTAADLEWQKPFLRSFLATIGGHVSREKDYQLPRRQREARAGPPAAPHHAHRGRRGQSRPRASRPGGIPAGLSEEGAASGPGSSPKDVSSVALGLSQVVSRRWLVGLNATRTLERGYLTEPYKVLSLLDGTTGLPTGQLTERRPASRERGSLLASSVYHLTDDVVFLSYRYYRDDWRIRSHTLDARYRRELGGGRYLEPHLRYYSQSPAAFYRSALVDGAPLPEFATADYRLGPLRSATLGATFGFRIPDQPGEWTVRAEYIRQFGDGHPADAVGVQRGFDLFPAVDIGSLLVGYSIEF